MADDDRPQPLGDPAAALLGTPVETNRARQGKTQAQYLEEGPGDTTLTGMRAAGLLRQRRRRKLLLAIGGAFLVGLGAGLAILLTR